jgi:hypothetical protein
MTDLLNENDCDLDLGDNVDDSDSYLDEDDLPIEYSLQSQVSQDSTRKF